MKASVFNLLLSWGVAVLEVEVYTLGKVLSVCERNEFECPFVVGEVWVSFLDGASGHFDGVLAERKGKCEAVGGACLGEKLGVGLFDVWVGVGGDGVHF